MKKHILLLSAFVFFFFSLSAQNPKWITYTNTDDVNMLANEGNILWVGTTGGIVRLEKNTPLYT